MSGCRVWIVQVFCGPNRHAVWELVGEADNIEEAEELSDELSLKITDSWENNETNPWCSLCGAQSGGWFTQLGRAPFRTLEEAKEPMLRNVLEQQPTNFLFSTHGPKPPTRN